MQFLAWHAVRSSLWLVTLRTLGGLWHCSRPSPLSTAFQPPHQQPHCVCATSCPWCAVLFLVLTCYADDLELSAECEFHLQVALDAVARWGRQWRFSFGIGPTKSAGMVFGPRRSIPPCSVHLGGNGDGVSLSGGDSDSHSLMDCPRPSFGHSGELTLRPVCCMVQNRRALLALCFHPVHLLRVAPHLLGVLPSG